METKLIDCSFVLAVKNLEISSAFYKDKMGFTLVWEAPGWKCWGRDTVKIMLGECPDDMAAAETGCHSYFGYFYVEYIDALYNEYLLRDIILRPLENKPWGMREFVIRTIDGHRICFGQQLEA